MNTHKGEFIATLNSESQSVRVSNVEETQLLKQKGNKSDFFKKECEKSLSMMKVVSLQKLHWTN